MTISGSRTRRRSCTEIVLALEQNCVAFPHGALFALGIRSAAGWGQHEAGPVSVGIRDHVAHSSATYRLPITTPVSLRTSFLIIARRFVVNLRP